jgi:DNA-binding transcriptional LysR family regulator
MDFEGLRDFRLVASHGGYGKASRASGRPKASLSKRVIDLENQLGVRLFDRENRKIRLTDEGVQLFARAEHLLDEIDQIMEDISAGIARPRGKLRIGAPSLFSQLWMGSLTTRFLRLYPEVTIESLIVERSNGAIDESVDLLIQVNPGAHVEMIGRIFARDEVRIVAPAAMVDALPNEDGEVLAIVPTGTILPSHWRIFLHGTEHKIKPRAVLQLPSRLMVRDAVREGLGIAELPKSIVAGDLQQGRLIDLGPALQRHVEVWALHHSRRLTTRKVTAFIDLLVDTFKGTLVEL